MHSFPQFTRSTLIFGVNFIVRVQFPWEQLSSGAIVRGAIFLGGNYPLGQMSGGQLSGGQSSRRPVSGGQFSSGAIVLEPYIAI